MTTVIPGATVAGTAYGTMTPTIMADIHADDWKQRKMVRPTITERKASGNHLGTPT